MSLIRITLATMTALSAIGVGFAYVYSSGPVMAAEKTITIAAPVQLSPTASEPMLELTFTNAQELEEASVVAEISIGSGAAASSRTVVSFFGASSQFRLPLPASVQSTLASSPAVPVEITLRTPASSAEPVPETRIEARVVR